jgi:hypothetical protein
VLIAPAYDRIGLNYSEVRRADPRFEAEIWGALEDAKSVLNVGAGAGSYEPTDREVIAVEPSPVMIAQRQANAALAIQGVAEALPQMASASPYGVGRRRSSIGACARPHRFGISCRPRWSSRRWIASGEICTTASGTIATDG